MAAPYPDDFTVVYNGDDEEKVVIYTGDGAEIEVSTRDMTIRDLEKIRKGLASAAKSVSDFSGAVSKMSPPAQRDGTFYTDDDFQESMETAELTGYHRGIEDVLLLIKEQLSAAGTQPLLDQIKALHNIEEGYRD